MSDSEIVSRMKYVQITGTPDPKQTPELFDLLARSSFVDETRLYDWNMSHEDGAAALLEVDGDIESFRENVSDTHGVRSADMNPVTDNRFVLLYELEPTSVPLLKKILSAITRQGIVVAKPAVYRDGQVQARIVGRAPILQEAVEQLPTELNIEISEIGDFNRSWQTPMSGLSERQREALMTAFELGYYEYPREATHEDIANHLECAPHTASEHLQKAEMTIISEVLQLEFER